MNKATYFIFKKAIQQDALILRYMIQKAYNSGLFVLYFDHDFSYFTIKSI